MIETATLNKIPATDAEYEAAIDQMMMQMQQTHADIADSHRRSVKLQVATREKMALRLENTLPKMGRLPAPKNEDAE